MTYKIVLTSPAKRDLAKIPEKAYFALLDLFHTALAENPYRIGKPLSGKWVGCHSARRGSYRVIYRIDDDAVVVSVIRIAHRADAYR